MNKRFRIGQEVWYRSTWRDVNSGIIEELKEVRRASGEMEPYVIIKGTRDTIINHGAYIKNCYATKEELLEALKAESEDTINKYCKQLNTVEDIIRFMYNENVARAEEYTDWDAREAVKKRVKELLNIDLEK